MPERPLSQRQKDAGLRIIGPLEGVDIGAALVTRASDWIRDNLKYTGELLGYRIVHDPYVIATNYEAVALVAYSEASKDVEKMERFLRGYKKGKLLAKQVMRGHSPMQAKLDTLDQDWKKLSSAFPEAGRVQ